MTPPKASHATSEIETTNVESIQVLVNTQTEQVVRLITTVKDISGQLLGSDTLKIYKGMRHLSNSIMVSDFKKMQSGDYSSIR